MHLKYEILKHITILKHLDIKQEKNHRGPRDDRRDVHMLDRTIALTNLPITTWDV